MSLMKYEMITILSKEYFDENGVLIPRFVLKLFQEVASKHATNIGVGYDYMIKNNLYWVLTRLKYDVIKMPTINQKVIVETWPHIKGKIDFDRDIRILNENREELVIATSKWCVIDSTKRMIQRTDNVNYVGEYYNHKIYDI